MVKSAAGVFATIPEFHVPEQSPPAYPLATYNIDLASLKAKLKSKWDEYILISESLNGHAPQLDTFEPTYKKWREEVDALEIQIQELLDSTQGMIGKLCNLDNIHKIGEAITTMIGLYLELLSLQEESNQLLAFLDMSRTHRNAVEIFKDVMQKCETFVAAKDHNRLVRLFKEVKVAIKDQQLVISTKDEALRGVISKIHLLLVEFILYSAKGCRLLLGLPPLDKTGEFEDEVAKLLATLLPAPLPEIHNLHIDPAASQRKLNLQQKVRSFLDACDDIKIEGAESFRQGQWKGWATVKYRFSISDVIEALTKIKQSMKKLMAALQTRFHELTLGSKTAIEALAGNTAAEELEFYEDCIIELERRLSQQRDKLYAKEYSPHIHAGINYSMQREGSLINLRGRIRDFRLASMDKNSLLYSEVLMELLAFLNFPKNDSLTSLDTVRALESIIVSMAYLPPHAEMAPGRVKKICEMTSLCVTSIVTQLGSKTILRKDEDRILMQKVVQGIPIDKIIEIKESFVQLPDQFKAVMAREIARILFSKEKVTSADFDLFLYTLKNHPSYKPYFEATEKLDPYFARDLEISRQVSDWESADSALLLERLSMIQCCLAKTKMGVNIKAEYSPQTFLNFVQAKQKVAEITALKKVSGKASLHLRLSSLLPALENKLTELGVQERYPEYFADLTRSPYVEETATSLCIDGIKLFVGAAPLPMYRLLVPLLFGELSQREKEKKEASLRLILKHVANAQHNELFDSDCGTGNYVELLLFKYLADRLAAVDLKNPLATITAKECDILRRMILKHLASLKSDGMLNGGYGECFVQATIVRLIAIESVYNIHEYEITSWQAEVDRIKADLHYPTLIQVIQASELQNAIKPNDKQSVEAYNAKLKAALDRIQNLPVSKSKDRISNMLHTAIMKCMKEMNAAK